MEYCDGTTLTDIQKEADEIQCNLNAIQRDAINIRMYVAESSGCLGFLG
jgi:hypothetical protein